MSALLVTLIGVVLTLFFAFWIDRTKLPKLGIQLGEENHIDHQYANGPHAGERWKFYRVKIVNRKIPWLLNKLIRREAAINCHATITFTPEGYRSPKSIMKARWITTRELPNFNNPQDAFHKLSDPDPVTIIPGHYELMDIIVKNENDMGAFGWNNEAYYYNWRTPSYKLDPGNYVADIEITSENGINTTFGIKIVISRTIDDTSIIPS